jgi:hypothetical protein
VGGLVEDGQPAFGPGPLLLREGLARDLVHAAYLTPFFSSPLLECDGPSHTRIPS